MTDYEMLTSFLRDRAGLDLAHYKPEQMQRRLQAAMSRMGAPSVGDLLRRARDDGRILQELIDRVTVNVSEFFRNPESFAVLEKTVLPELLLRRGGRLRIWSAGCSYGAEAYSLAILLAELLPGRNHAIMATDIDTAVLARAGEAKFSAQDLRSVSPARLKHFFTEVGDHWQIAPSLRRSVTFRHHNLLADPFDGGWHLIACRNVVIYFTEAAKSGLYQRFFDALAPGGYLLIGSTEQILRPAAIGYETPYPFFYRKPALDRT